MPKPLPSDQVLLGAAAAGDESAFARLYHRYDHRLRRYFATRLPVGSVKAEDLSQQVFLQLLDSKAFRQAGSGPEDLAPLLFSMAANLLKNEYRGQLRREERERVYAAARPVLEVPITDPDDPLPLGRALDHLPEEQRRVIELRFRSELSVEDVARITNTKVGTVKSRLHYGLKKLAKLLSRQNETA